jgi:3-oxoacyl-[acyl-carrier protein] reductase
LIEPRERIALITGGARGIGRAIALDLATQGWSIALAYRTSRDDAEATVHEIGRAGARGLAVQADVSDPEQVAMLLARVSEELAAPDALVHAAGPYHRVDILKETPEGWRNMFANNLDSLFYCARAAAPAMIANRWGRILAFSMANADRAAAQPGVAAHYIAKVGVLALVRSLARALAPHGITVNAISPGFVASGSAPEEELAKMVKNIPAGYVGTLDDTTACARYLLSEQARYVNGANVVLSGGWGL